MNELDDIDTQIVAMREEWFNQQPGPRVGDFVKFSDEHLERFSHDVGDSLQTTALGFWPAWHLAAGHITFTGGLCKRVLLKTELVDTGETKPGSFWVFHHDHYHNGKTVEFEIDCRVYRCKDPATK